MTKTSYKRRRILIDMPIQVALLLRATLYWIVCVLTQVFIINIVSIVASNSAEPNAFTVPAVQMRWLLQLVVVASVLILPAILYDVVRLSHRWVGPIYRLRTALQALSRGETVPPISFRAGDFWQELAGDFNVVADELKRRREAAPKDARS
jgi:nitrogen fixation/metabolism regulation signal transduction histidine kinase